MTEDAPAVAPTPNPPPVLERMDRLSFPQYLGIGAGIGLLCVVLAWAIGPGADARAPGGVARAGVEAKAGAGAGAKGGAGAGGGADGGAGAGEGGAGGGGAEGGGADAAEGAAEAGAAEAGAAEEAGAADGSAEEGAEAGGTAEGGAADDAADDAAAADGADGETGATSTADAAAGDDEVAIEDDGGSRSTSKPSPRTSPTPTSDPSGESAMTAEELLEEAKKALSEKRYRDAYRLATRSGYKKKSNETYTVKAKAACGMKDEASAKDAFKSLPMGDDRRKAIRDYCKEKGVRLGI